MAVSAVLAVGLALAACSPTPDLELELPPQSATALPDATVEQLQAAVENAMVSAGASGAIVGVWAPWSGSWVAGLGAQSPADGAAEVAADMQFRASRITRPMICDVLYAAVAEGKVKLDDPVSEWVASVPVLEDVTLEQLCDSTSGIGAYAPHLLPMWLSNPERTWSPRELASFGLGEARTTKPGVAYRDSDAGYVLLGLALENALDAPAAELIEEYVAQPLGLEQTHLGGLTGDTVLEGLFSPPVEGGKRNCVEPLDVTDVSPSSAYTDSGVVSDIDDLGRYAQALATGALQPGVDDRFADPAPAGASAPSWNTVAGGAVQAGSLIGQFGAVPGYTTAAFSDPGTGLTIAVVLNNSAGGAGFGAYLAWELAAIASKAPAAAGEAAPEAGLPWTAEQYHAEIVKRAICAPAA
ncbi:serine hydrolase domain-containing protein [Microbacterium sp. SSM24]|uniref:serine hydrolase domain-containing protein n=1 Tax=Microbacterium sp. SSM24 TaxID=2991714 RepID=UPI00222800D6|nr:serine hydrolase domain-containing protein [Microbacterium sp. SSM24]MCW3493044.1 beta-lactamase family protein [Microbacterium sp. SSM24]